MSYIPVIARQPDACNAISVDTYSTKTVDLMDDILVRIVQLTLAPDEVEHFLKMFDEVSPKIRSFDGCKHLELLQNPTYPNIVCTYSHWISISHLNAYRESQLFKSTWAQTKKMFAAPPQAQSFHKIRNLI